MRSDFLNFCVIFQAVFLGGYILIDETMLKAIYKKINIDFATDFEARIRKLAEIIRNSPTNDTDEFIRHLSLEEWAKELKESVEYFKVTIIWYLKIEPAFST